MYFREYLLLFQDLCAEILYSFEGEVKGEREKKVKVDGYQSRESECAIHLSFPLLSLIPCVCTFLLLFPAFIPSFLGASSPVLFLFLLQLL